MGHLILILLFIILYKKEYIFKIYSFSVNIYKYLKKVFEIFFSFVYISKNYNKLLLLNCSKTLLIFIFDDITFNFLD